MKVLTHLVIPLTNTMENRRFRNYLIHSEKDMELEKKLSEMRADQIEYVNDHYKAHFRQPRTVPTMKKKLAGLNVEALPRRDVNSFYNQLSKKYEKKIRKGSIVEKFLKDTKMDPQLLEKTDFNLVTFYRTMRGKGDDLFSERKK